LSALERRQSDCPNPNDDLCINQEGNVLDTETERVYSDDPYKGKGVRYCDEIVEIMEKKKKDCGDCTL
jgi:hypothetical protein